MIRIKDYAPLTTDYSMLSEKDRALISKSFDLCDTEWDLVSKLESQAESEESKKMLHNRQMHLYHKEEQSSGLL